MHDLIYRHNQRRGSQNQHTVSDFDYQTILEAVRSAVSRDHASELAVHMGATDYIQRLRSLIMRYVNLQSLADDTNINQLVERIYYDMAGLSIIDRYLADPMVEEININGWQPGDIWIYTQHGKYQAPEGFPGIEEAQNIVTKAARLGGITLDGSKPFGDSYLSKGVRMSGVIPPVTHPDYGAVASIRIQRKSVVTRENIVKWGTATDEQLDLLITCVRSGISVAFAGSTGSGKTADLSLILENIPDKERILTIEDTSELNLKSSENGKVKNDRVHMLTREPPNEVSMLNLVKSALRFHPKILVPAEMRGEEAWTVQEAGRTGHTIVSTLHANSALDAYDRILTMSLLANISLSEERILKNIVSAFPLMVFKKQMADGSRKFMEIFEATGVRGNEVTGHTLYKFVVTGSVKDEEGEIREITGYHTRINPLSSGLCQRLFEEGVDLEFIRNYNPKYEPAKG